MAREVERSLQRVLIDSCVELRCEWKHKDAVQRQWSQGDVLVARCLDISVAQVPPFPHHHIDTACPCPTVECACKWRVHVIHMQTSLCIDNDELRRSV